MDAGVFDVDAGEARSTARSRVRRGVAASGRGWSVSWSAVDGAGRQQDPSGGGVAGRVANQPRFGG
ncbi:hypothetical protein SBI_00038 [Streptomyces bingchenggensis BCW-1]|uniref:Uncharacterized protein n=1 Tax=Streptomyces bingchenggensis (strain BCW-1) TaxID=749414 RepID=D7BSY2_STRBB|nr:hypothetical protein SBI_00038 [Streptomyces bingchenggensis BCW-1]